jgi:rubrerythrin
VIQVKQRRQGHVPDILASAIEIEDEIERFYVDLAAQPKSRRTKESGIDQTLP